MKSAKADEIFSFASDEIKSTHPPSRRISPNEVGFHRRRRFHPPARVDLVEKPTSRNLSVFLERVMGVEPTRPAWKAGILPLNYTRITEFIITPKLRVVNINFDIFLLNYNNFTVVDGDSDFVNCPVVI